MIKSKIFSGISTQTDSFFESFNYFEALFASTKQNTVLLMDAGGVITAINDAFTNSFGYTWEDIIGKNIKILFTAEAPAKRLTSKRA